MKKTIFKLSLTLIMTSMLTAIFSQVSTYERQPGYWTLGINGGLAYQQSDIPSTLEGYGFGLTLGKNLFYKPGSGLAFDLRGRGLYTKSYGLDYFQSEGIKNNNVLNGTNILDYTKLGGGPGFVYQNNKTDHVELGLEGVVTFNKLREKTNVIFSIFGGIGVDWYNTKIDQTDANGIYSPQYESLNPTASVSYKKSQLQNVILDGVYETNAQGFENGTGRLGIMPSLGFELGYQLTPRFSMGIGHKITYTKTDLFDGQQWTNDNLLTTDNDILHYTNLNMRWILDKKEKELKPPVIKIIKPEIDPFTTRDPNGFVKANIKYVANAMDVRITVNGYSKPFNFKNENFNSTFRLQPGRNDVLITASNLAGSDQESVVIFYEEPFIDNTPQGNRPTVDFTNPPYDNFRTADQRFVVKATIRNIYDKRNIRFTINGISFRNFNFDSRTNLFSATINLDEGQNNLKIEVRNNIGNDFDDVTIILEKAILQLPVVDITKPFDDPFYTSDSRVILEAKLYNIVSKNDIRFTINGRRSSDFTYSNETLHTNIDLFDYKTRIIIEANNSVGRASDDTVIFFEEQDDEPEIDAPVVTINSMSQPTIDPFDPDNCRSTVIASILNVENAGDISFILNGRKYYDFSFNPNTGVLKTTIKLKKGNNEIIIKAQNEAGSDQDRVTKKGCKLTEYQPVVTITKPGKISISVTNPKTKITATVLNIGHKNDIVFLINGKKVYNFTFNSNTKIFNAGISLLEGINTIVVSASNKNGRAKDQVNIVYKKPFIQVPHPPQVTILRPASKSTTAVKVVSLDAKLLNINSKNEIEVFLNGRQTSNFNFNNKTQKVIAQLSLKKGTNTIRVKATNADGKDEKAVTITFTPPAPKLPEVKFTLPKNSIETDQANARIKAIIKNVVSKKAVNLFVNEKATPFSFSRGILSADLKLLKGKNIITIKASNGDGNDEATIIITYSPPLPKPTVKFLNPSKAGKIVDVNKITIEAIVKNVSNKKNILIKVNGSFIKTFDFQPRTQKVTATISLKEGLNNIFIEGKNSSGTASAKSSVKLVKPVEVETIPAKVRIISVSEPTIDPFNPNKAKSTIIAKMENVSSKKEITFTINGKQVKSFSFDSKTQLFQTTINLVKGKTKILIKVENQDGSQEAGKTITF